MPRAGDASPALGSGLRPEALERRAGAAGQGPPQRPAAGPAPRAEPHSQAPGVARGLRCAGAFRRAAPSGPRRTLSGCVRPLAAACRHPALPAEGPCPGWCWAASPGWTDPPSIFHGSAATEVWCFGERQGAVFPEAAYQIPALPLEMHPERGTVPRAERYCRARFASPAGSITQVPDS